MTEVRALAQRVIDLADGDANMGNFIIGSPLVGAIMLRGCARCYLGDPGWTSRCRAVHDDGPRVRPHVARVDAALQIHADRLTGCGCRTRQRCRRRLRCLRSRSDPATISRWPAPGTCAASCSLTDDGPQRDDAIALLAAAREAALQERFTLVAATWVDTCLADEKARVGDLDGAIELSRAAVEADYACGEMIVRAAPSPLW